MNAHYVYKITNINPVDSRKYYIGVRTAPSGNPEEDTDYMGSSVPLKEAIQAQGLEFFSKEILSTWETRELAEQEEARIHKEYRVSINDNFYNLMESSGKPLNPIGYVRVVDTRTGMPDLITREEFKKNTFYQHNTKGKTVVLDRRDGKRKHVPIEDFQKYDHFIHQKKNLVTVLDIRDGKTKSVTQEEFDNSDYYIGSTKGMVVVLDKRDGKTKSVTQEEFDNLPYYVGTTKGMVMVLDKRDGTRKTVTKEEFESYDFYVGGTVGKTLAIDTRTGKTVSVTKEEYDSCDYYVNAACKKIQIFNNNGELQYESFGDFKKFCKFHNLPKYELQNSYLNDGRPMYRGIKNPANPKFKLKGWFAKEVEKQ